MKNLSNSLKNATKVGQWRMTKRLTLGFSLFVFLSASQMAVAQEIDCSTAVEPSSILKLVKKKAVAKKLQIAKVSKSKLSNRTFVVRTSLYPATIIKMQGKVQVVSRQGIQLANPIDLAIGASLERGDTLRTYEQSFVSFELGDGVISVVPSNSSITLNQASGNKVARYELEHGRVESYVPKRSHPTKNTFEIQVPNAIVGVRGTHFIVTQLPDIQQSKLSVEDGTVWVRSRKVCQAPVVVESGHGANLDKIDSGIKAVTLLAPPTFKSLQDAYRQDQVLFDLTPVQGAVEYQVQIAKDPEFIDLQKETRSVNPKSKIDMTNMTNGFYYVRSSAFDKTGIEGETDNRFFLKVKNPTSVELEDYAP